MPVRMKPGDAALTVTPCARALHKEAAVACVRILEDGGGLALPANPFCSPAINA
jgi:hypothetical protein